MDRRVSGSEFHIAGPDTEKARVPNCVLVRWMTAALFVDDRSLCRWVSSAENVTRSAKYGGHWPCRIRCISTAILKVVRYCTGNQCSHKCCHKLLFYLKLFFTDRARYTWSLLTGRQKQHQSDTKFHSRNPKCTSEYTKIDSKGRNTTKIFGSVPLAQLYHTLLCYFTIYVMNSILCHILYILRYTI